MTGGRLRRVKDYVSGDECFCFTYGDGVADIDIAAEIAFHRAHGKQATVTAVQPPGRYGALRLDGARVDGFIEKPRGDGGLINGGFFVLSPRVIDRIDGDSTSWEQEPLAGLAARRRADGVRARRLLAADGHAAREEPARRAVAVGPRALEAVVSGAPTMPTRRDR